MLLYHYTCAVNALLISGSGLKPKCNDDIEFMTMGTPVVWLTKEESNIATKDDITDFTVKYMTVGEPLYGGLVRCTVNIERSRHVVRYEEFLRTTKSVEFNEAGTHYRTGRDLIRLHDKAGPKWKSWWICTRAIPTSKILIPLTRAQAIEACEWQVERHPDADGRENFKKQRDEFAAQPENATFVFHDGKCRLVNPACSNEQQARAG